MRILWHEQNSYRRNAKVAEFSVDNADSVFFNVLSYADC